MTAASGDALVAVIALPSAGEVRAVTGPDNPAETRPIEVVTLVPLIPPDASTLAIRTDDAWAEAGRKVLRLHLERMLAHVPGVVAGVDAEEVHAMRVSARRMRAAWRVFGSGFERDATRSYRPGLRDVGARLGAVRDLDVLIELLATYGNHRSVRQRAGLEPLLASWRAERAARHVELVTELASQRFIEFVSVCEHLASTPGYAAVAPEAHAPGIVRHRMPAVIWAAYEAVWAFERDVETPDLATFHQLRIAAKWLRYTLEFVREPIDPAGTTLIAPIVALQDHLGTQHDADVARTSARKFAMSTPLTNAQATALAAFVGHLDQRVERLDRTFGSSWRPIVAPGYRRNLGRAIARL